MITNDTSIISIQKDTCSQFHQFKWLNTALSKDDTRAVLQGIFRDEDSLIAIDGRRLHKLTFDKPEILDHMGFINQKIYALQVNKANEIFYSQSIEGNYPNYKQVIPDFKQYLSPANAKKRLIDLKEGKLKIKSSKANVDNKGLGILHAYSKIIAQTPISLNDDFFHQALGIKTLITKNNRSQDWTFYTKDDCSPLLMESRDDLTETTLNTVVMPMRLR